jgi:hypothetical protein
MLSLKRFENGTMLVGGGWQGIGSRADGRGDTFMAGNLIGKLPLAGLVLPVLHRARAVRAWLGLESKTADDLPVPGRCDAGARPRTAAVPARPPAAGACLMIPQFPEGWDGIYPSTDTPLFADGRLDEAARAAQTASAEATVTGALAVAEVSDGTRRLHAISLAAGMPGRIAWLVEYWGEAGDPPAWRRP